MCNAVDAGNAVFLNFNEWRLRCHQALYSCVTRASLGNVDHARAALKLRHQTAVAIDREHKAFVAPAGCISERRDPAKLHAHDKNAARLSRFADRRGDRHHRLPRDAADDRVTDHKISGSLRILEVFSVAEVHAASVVAAGAKSDTLTVGQEQRCCPGRLSVDLSEYPVAVFSFLNGGNIPDGLGKAARVRDQAFLLACAGDRQRCCKFAGLLERVFAAHAEPRKIQNEHRQRGQRHDGNQQPAKPGWPTLEIRHCHEKNPTPDQFPRQ